MKIKRLLYNNRMLRGLAAIYRTYFTLKKSKLGFCGKNVALGNPIAIGNPRNVYLQDYVSIGKGSTISAINAKFIMKKWSFSGPNLNVRTGNHCHVVGIPSRFIDDKYKKEHDLMRETDKDIIVEEDVWLGSNVTLLSGSHVKRGCIVAAGAVVTGKSDMPEYSVWGGVPAKFIKFKWNKEEIVKHESILYPENERLSIEYIDELFISYAK